jgi:CheY-like chemotaxis protein
MSEPVVAVINSNDDLVKVLRDALIREGLDVVTAHIRDFKTGKLSFPDYLRNHDPAVVVYDISVPYEDNWAFLQTLLALPESQARAFVVTTVNKRVLDRRIGPSGAIEIQGGRADDLDPVIEAVQKQLRRRADTHAGSPRR